jgi:hypothetical protein
MMWRKASPQPEESLSDNRLGFLGLAQSYGRLPVGERFQALEGIIASTGDTMETKITEIFDAIRQFG